MKTIIERIKDFLEGRPIASEATGMFIERDDLREIVESKGRAGRDIYGAVEGCPCGFCSRQRSWLEYLKAALAEGSRLEDLVESEKLKNTVRMVSADLKNLQPGDVAHPSFIERKQHA